MLALWAVGDAGRDVPPARPIPTSPDAELELLLNIPAYRLDVVERGARGRSYRVAIGMPEFPTPTERFTIAKVTWNPWWIPPDREWARNETITPPGPKNPMGRVKLHAGGLLFLHGTPDTASLGRAASHGCVRLSNADAIELARAVQARASPRLTPKDLDLLERNPSLTRTFVLDDPVPLTIVYEVAEVRDGTLLIHPDVYRRMRGGATLAEAEGALERAGIPASSVDTDRLAELVRASRRETVAVPIDTLLLPRGDGGTALSSPAPADPVGISRVGAC
jgi:murein L,D-transpeptidase YcbB/YkuD